MENNRPLIGIAFMLLYCVFTPLADALGKQLAMTTPIGQVLFLRFALPLIVLLPLIHLRGIKWQMTKAQARMIGIRAVLHVVGIGMMLLALRYVPLADAVAIVFLMPCIVLVLSHFVLGEEVGARRMLACLVGFVGCLFVIKPSFVTVGWAAFLPLGVALTFSVFTLLTRKLRGYDSVALQASGSLMALLILVPVMLIDMSIGGNTTTGMHLSGTLLTIAMAYSMFGLLSHYVLTLSLKYAPAATVTPIQYVELPVAVWLGYAFFDEMPQDTAIIGIPIIIIAGLYIIYREQVLQRGAAQPAE